jgi:hypothetical protein
MSEQATYEGVLELFRQSDQRSNREFRKMRRETKERIAASERQMKELRLQIKRTSKEVGKLGSSIGRIIEHMVAGDNIIKKFKNLDYKIGDYSRNKKFGRDLPREFWGEVDLFLENGDIAILIEVKTTLETKDVATHIERLEKFRRVADIKGDKRRFIGAVAGAVIEGDAEDFAHENGMYVIVQSGKAVEILPVPEGFQAKEW